MKKDTQIFVEHILESIAFIEEYTKDLTLKDFFEDQQVQDSVFRRLEIIGEAVKNLPEVFKSKHENVPWKQIAGMRDVLIHEYFGVDIMQVWNTLKKDLPLLKNELKD
jgi:uncharacterized protein with HEPN domain